MRGLGSLGALGGLWTKILGGWEKNLTHYCIKGSPISTGMPKPKHFGVSFCREVAKSY